MPKALTDRPTLKPHLQPYIEAFFDLSSSRTLAQYTSNPLSIVEIRAYEPIFGVWDRAGQRRFMRYMKALDGVYLEYQAERLAREAKNKNKSA